MVQNSRSAHCRRVRTARLTDDFAGGAARVDEPLSGAEFWRETAADKGVKNTVTAVGHHRSVTRQLVFLQS